MTIPNEQNARACWAWFKQNTDLPDVAVAAILGNIWAESNFLPNNLENRLNIQSNITDAEYCRQVNAGTYRFKDWKTCRDSFARDSGGFGLAQWTLRERKFELYDKTVAAGIPVEDLQTQCALAWEELRRDFAFVNKVLHTSNDLRTCTVEFLVKFENPAVKSDDVQNLRTKYAQTVFDAYSGKQITEPVPVKKKRTKTEIIFDIRKLFDELEDCD